MNTTQVHAYAAKTATSALVPFAITRRALRPRDVKIEILFCGVCHSDIHAARNEWGGTHYPFVPGHEIVGRVSEVGRGVSQHKVGDLVGIGCLVDSCRQCRSCKEGLEQYCENGWTGTYNGKDNIGGTPHKYTFGGYSETIAVDQRFVLRVPKNLDLAATAPLLCAGITTYSPLKHWNVGKGQKAGIIGLGGLGHMGVKFAHAMGAKVVMITTSPKKGADARKLGADDVLISKNKAAMDLQK
jgi:uncharacterized zinc-type alcohol dehydrogenase-like protein